MGGDHPGKSTTSRIAYRQVEVWAIQYGPDDEGPAAKAAGAGPSIESQFRSKTLKISLRNN